jgi:glutathione S-transferase
MVDNFCKRGKEHSDGYCLWCKHFSLCQKGTGVSRREKDRLQTGPVNPFTAGPEYRKLSPLGRIPAFQDDKTTLADSSVICAYVERTNPQPALYPTDAVAYAQALWF